MNEEDEQKSDENDGAEEHREEKLRYEYVPYDVRPEEDLYAFREALTAPPEAQPKVGAKGKPAARPPMKRKQMILLAAAAVGCIGLAILAIYSLQLGPPPPPYVDLGSSNVAGSGLSGDLVARWTGKANYVFYLNPLSASDLPGFSAVADNPPVQLLFTIHLKDNGGITVCEKEILFPFKAPEDGSAVPTQGPPARTMDGDAITYDRGDHDQIARIEVKGPLNCPESLYTRIAVWDFSTTFPARSDQDDWVANLEGIKRRQVSQKRTKSAPVQPMLPSPIDGDDVIVGDNPSHGTVLTRAGREFYVGPGGLSSHGEGWGFFPVAFHFHCDVKGNCTLSRAGAVTTVFARLMK